MPVAEIGQRIEGVDRRTPMLELKSKNETAHIRFIQASYAWDAKHFIKDKVTHKYTVTPCDRLLFQSPCVNCEIMFDLIKGAKSDGSLNEASLKKEIEEIRKEYAPASSFYYPVLNRETQEVILLKTTLSVRLRIDEENEKRDITKYDYLITRTEDPGKSYYTVERVDSEETSPISEKESAEISLVKSWNLQALIGDSNPGSKQLGTTPLEELPNQPDGSEDITLEELEEVEEEEIKTISKKIKKEEPDNDLPF